MPTLIVAAPAPLSGKTTVAVALARAISKSGQSSVIERSGDDANADSDRQVFATLSSAGDLRIVEVPGGTSSDLPKSGEKVLVVATPATSTEAAALAKSAGDSLAGVILNRVPAKGENTSYEGIAPIAVIPEDRTLGAPNLAAVAVALEAESENLEGHEGMLLDAPIIASIAADPGQAYFDRTRASSVIVRSDKPDLQLAALNSGAECFIITGELPLLSYVRDRIAEEEIPVLRTALDTQQTVTAIEKLYGGAPFQAEAVKLTRVGELFAALDVSRLLT
jgi:BioD-like phosphotransacetylase family protein